RLPRIEVVHELSDDALLCENCGTTLEPMGTAAEEAELIAIEQRKVMLEKRREFPAGEPVSTGQEGGQRHEARPETTCGDLLRQLGPGESPASLAFHPIELVLGNDRADRRDLGDLVSDGIPDHGLGAVEGGLAVGATLGTMGNDLVRFGHGAVMPLMPRLPSWFLAARFLGVGFGA
ncbi:MAG TPA: hypothetical protein V6C82_08505, partial [Chroococcales cyanobacterium]